MTRVDHAAEAREWIAEGAVSLKSLGGWAGVLVASLAQAEATLALVEQQKIANLIALARVQFDQESNYDESAELRAVARQGLIRYVEHQALYGEPDEHPEIHPDIAAALGLPTENEEGDRG